MTSRLLQVTVDCRDPHRLANFWAAVLDYTVIEDRGDKVEIASWEPTVEAVRQQPIPSTVMFIRVPEAKTTKNRLHLDVMPIDASQDDEVDRLIGLGASRVDLGQGEQTWVVMADPEGNEFCVLRSIAP
ncbi:VOC family protein [Dactylosporangium sp. AC04546]|uniref:VOC family protein n=1 Tax=Dactylosporangium sp. AC04546 TaxID=2862460 RepID=UPI001EDE1D66|nr:VOC family protein [Dactylosporangium sp. AC04546]WVK89625.1 VOC family protein [Dactylosporangium sp. AC04546]